MLSKKKHPLLLGLSTHLLMLTWPGSLAALSHCEAPFPSQAVHPCGLQAARCWMGRKIYQKHLSSRNGFCNVSKHWEPSSTYCWRLCPLFQMVLIYGGTSLATMAPLRSNQIYRLGSLFWGGWPWWNTIWNSWIRRRNWDIMIMLFFFLKKRRNPMFIMKYSNKYHVE